MEYQFKPMSKKCAATGEDLAPGSTCYSVLVEQDGELVRLDYAEKSWPGPPAGTVGTWKCIVPKAAEVKQAPLDLNALVRHFEQLMEESDPTTEKLRYILALSLWQKRRLRLDGTRPDGDDEYLQFTATPGDGAYEVRDLHLSDAEMEELQRELNAHLAAEWG